MNWQSKTGQDLHTFTQGSYAVTNLMARYDITRNLSATLNLNNVFDRKYFSTSTAGRVRRAPQLHDRRAVQVLTTTQGARPWVVT